MGDHRPEPLVFFVIQPDSSPAADEFAYRNAAIACELTTGDPVDIFEINSGTCLERSQGEQPFPDKNVWLAVLVSMFLHAGIAHILFNMWSMWIFGNNVEEAYGHLAFALFYVAAGVAATAGFVILEPDTTVPLVGASGAIAGVMGAYLVLFPPAPDPDAHLHPRWRSRRWLSSGCGSPASSCWSAMPPG